MFLIYKKNYRIIKSIGDGKASLLFCWDLSSGLQVSILKGNDYLNNLLFHRLWVAVSIRFIIRASLLLSDFYLVYIGSMVVVSFRPFAASIVKKRINSTLEQFFAVIILSTFVMLSLISSKLAIYSLPIVPFLIFLTVLQLNKFDMQNVWIKLTIALPAVIFILALPELFT